MGIVEIKVRVAPGPETSLLCIRASLSLDNFVYVVMIMSRLVVSYSKND
jgi:hypothetical protein